MAVEIVDEDVLVGRPGASCHQHAVVGGKGFYHRQRTCGIVNVNHTVKAGVADDGYILFHPDAGKEAARNLVLHEKVCDAAQATGVVAAVPAEEHLVGAEDAAHAVDGDVAAVEHIDVVAPELVLNQHKHFGLCCFDKTTYRRGGVERQVAHHIGHIVVLAHFVARRGEEGEQDFAVGLLAAQALHKRPPLLKLAQRSSVKPHITLSFTNLVVKDAPRFVLAAHHQSGFPMTEAGEQAHDEGIEINAETVHRLRRGIVGN